MGVFFREKVLFFIVRPLFASFWAPFSVFSCPFGLFLFRFLLLFCFFFCRFCFSCIFLFSRLLFCVLPFFCYSYFLLLISYFSLFPFSFLFISFVYDCPLFCLRCGRELRSIGKLRCRAGIDAVCKKRSRESYTIPLSTPNFSSAWHSPAGSTCTRISYILSIEFSILFSTASAMSCAWVTVICGFTSMSSVMM